MLNYNNTADDFSCKVAYFAEIPTILHPILDILFSILILMGNFLVIIVIGKESTLHTHNSYFIIQLSCADILVELYLPINAASHLYK